MRTFLKVAAVLMLSFGGYYLLMGLSALMASGQIGQVAQSMDETIKWRNPWMKPLIPPWHPRRRCSWG